jgi:hypothetical protein
MWLRSSTQRFKTNSEIAHSRCEKDDAVWAIAGCWADYEHEETIYGVMSWHREFDCAIEEAADYNLQGKYVQVINASLYMEWLTELRLTGR